MYLFYLLFSDSLALPGTVLFEYASQSSSCYLRKLTRVTSSPWLENENYPNLVSPFSLRVCISICGGVSLGLVCYQRGYSLSSFNFHLNTFYVDFFSSRKWESLKCYKTNRWVSWGSVLYGFQLILCCLQGKTIENFHW